MSDFSLFTIGFTRKSARTFFGLLGDAGVRRVIDVRLYPRTQLAGFTKSGDLAYFLQEIAEIEYLHQPLLCPTPELFDYIKKEGGSWDAYQRRYLALLREREVEHRLEPALFDRACLLCAEATPEHCHRRLAAEYLEEKWGGVQVKHL